MKGLGEENMKNCECNARMINGEITLFGINCDRSGNFYILLRIRDSNDCLRQYIAVRYGAQLFRLLKILLEGLCAEFSYDIVGKKVNYIEKRIAIKSSEDQTCTDTIGKMLCFCNDNGNEIFRINVD